MDTGRSVDNARLLADDPVGVERETSPRKIQKNGETTFYTYLSGGWLRQMNGATQGEPVYHSLTLGVCPIIVTEPAIIVQPVGAMAKRRERE